MRRIKILFFEQIYTKYVVQLSKTISSDEFNVNYIACLSTQYWEQSNVVGPNHRESIIKSLSIPIKTGSRGTHFEVISFDFLLHLLKYKPDLVVIDPNPAFSIFYLLLAKILGSKILGFTTHIPDKSSLWGKISDFILKSNDFLIDSYVVPSSIKKQLMIKLGIDANKINVIGHGIDTKKFGLKTTENRIKFPTTKKIILFVGRFVAVKGIKFLVESFEIVHRKMDDVYLVLIGDGPLKQEIAQLIKDKKLDNDILQISNIINSEMPDYYSESDIVAFPSLGPESFGMVLVEAMSSGKPVIAFCVGGAEKDIIVDGKNGFLVKQKNVNEFATSMLELLSNEQKRKVIGNQAREFAVQNYDFQIIASHWKRIIKNILEKKNEF